ncbi:MAG: DnaA N-terminal domain-containing protein, partial [Holophaga sp.]
MSANDPQAIWDSLQKGLAAKLPERTFQDWIEPCRAVTFDGSTLWIQTPSASARVWIEQQLAEEFHDALFQCGLPHLRLAFTVAGDSPAPAPLKSSGKGKHHPP